MNTSYLLAGTSSTNPNMLIIEVLILIAGFNAAAYGVDYWLIPRFRRWMKYEVEPSAVGGLKRKSGA